MIDYTTGFRDVKRTRKKAEIATKAPSLAYLNFFYTVFPLCNIAHLGLLCSLNWLLKGASLQANMTYMVSQNDCFRDVVDNQWVINCIDCLWWDG